MGLFRDPPGGGGPGDPKWGYPGVGGDPLGTPNPGGHPRDPLGPVGPVYRLWPGRPGVCLGTEPTITWLCSTYVDNRYADESIVDDLGSPDILNY